jgi:hypothetical protein
MGIKVNDVSLFFAQRVWEIQNKDLKKWASFDFSLSLSLHLQWIGNEEKGRKPVQ